MSGAVTQGVTPPAAPTVTTVSPAPAKPGAWAWIVARAREPATCAGIGLVLTFGGEVMKQIVPLLALNGAVKWFGIVAVLLTGIIAIAKAEKATTVVQIGTDIQGVLPIVEAVVDKAGVTTVTAVPGAAVPKA